MSTSRYIGIRKNGWRDRYNTFHDNLYSSSMKVIGTIKNELYSLHRSETKIRYALHAVYIIFMGLDHI